MVLCICGGGNEESSYVEFEDVNFCCKTFCPKKFRDILLRCVLCIFTCINVLCRQFITKAYGTPFQETLNCVEVSAYFLRNQVLCITVIHEGYHFSSDYVQRTLFSQYLCRKHRRIGITVIS